MAIICFDVYCPPLLPCASDCVRTPRFRKTPAQTDNRRDVLDALLYEYSNYGARHSAPHRRQNDRLHLSVYVFVYTHTHTPACLCKYKLIVRTACDRTNFIRRQTRARTGGTRTHNPVRPRERSYEITLR